MSVDAFLRALQRDVAWDFFYGTVNFDDVFGTVNHYGTVDMFAGRFNDAYRKAELDHIENFETPLIRETFKAMLDDWTNEGFDPFASPAETGQAVRRQGRLEHRRRSPAAASTAKRMVGVPGDEQIRTDATHPINRMFADVPQDEPEVHAEPGFEDEVARVQPVRLPQPLATSRGTRRCVSVCKASLYCPTTEEYILPVIHGNDRVEWFVQLSRRDRLGRPGPRHRRAAGEGDDEGRRRRGDARRHPPPGLQPEALDAAGVGERLARAPGADPHRQGERLPRRVLIAV